MIFNTRKLVTEKVGDLTLHIRPLDAMQQAEVLDLIDGVDTTVKVVEVAKLAIGYGVEKVEGLFDEDGTAIECIKDRIHGLSVLTLRAIIDVVVKAGNLEERYAKKS